MSKNAIITGASRGIGRAVATALARRGHHVTAVARSEDALAELKRQHPDYIRYHTADLKDPDASRRLAEELDEFYPDGMDILVNNAGALIKKPFRELTTGDWRHMLDVNLMSAVHLVNALVPQLRKKSHIVNISSMGGFQGSSKFPGLTAYSVAKGALSILSECLAVELADHDIRVNALCLGSVQTAMFGRAFPDFEADVQPDAMGTYIADFALNGCTFYNGKVLPVALSNPS